MLCRLKYNKYLINIYYLIKENLPKLCMYESQSLGASPHDFPVNAPRVLRAPLELFHLILPFSYQKPFLSVHLFVFLLNLIKGSGSRCSCIAIPLHCVVADNGLLLKKKSANVVYLKWTVINSLSLRKCRRKSNTEKNRSISGNEKCHATEDSWGKNKWRSYKGLSCLFFFPRHEYAAHRFMLLVTFVKSHQEVAVSYLILSGFWPHYFFC